MNSTKNSLRKSFRKSVKFVKKQFTPTAPPTDVIENYPSADSDKVSLNGAASPRAHILRRIDTGGVRT